MAKQECEPLFHRAVLGQVGKVSSPSHFQAPLGYMG